MKGDREFEVVLVILAGFLGDFFSTLTSKGSSITMPAGGERWTGVPGLPLAPGSVAGAYVAALLATRIWTRVYRFLVLVVVLSVVHLLVVDSDKYLQHT